MNELFRLYTAERSIDQRGTVSIDLIVEEEMYFCFRECMNVIAKTLIACIIHLNELGIDLEKSINSKIAIRYISYDE
jgi:hypothetical protein